MERINTDKPTDFYVSEVQTMVLAFFMFPFLVGTFYGAVFYKPATADATMGKFLSWFGLAACILFYYYLWKAGKFHNKPILSISKEGIYINQYQGIFPWENIIDVLVSDTGGKYGKTRIEIHEAKKKPIVFHLDYVRPNPKHVKRVIEAYQNTQRTI